MLAPSCWLRPSGIVGHLPVPEGAAPDLHRTSPFPGLLPIWQETFAFDLTTATLSEESAVSRIIYGPFIVLEIAFRASTAATVSLFLRLGVGDNGTLPTTTLGSPYGIPASGATDTTRTVGAFYLTNVFERHTLYQEFRTGTARLIWMFNNTSGVSINVVGHVTIQHCAEMPAYPQAPTS